MPALGWRSPDSCIVGGESEFGEQEKMNQNWCQEAKIEVVVTDLRNEEGEMRMR